MRSQRGVTRLGTLVLTVAGLLVAGLLAELAAQSFRITDFRRAGEEVRVDFESDTNAYYILFWGEQPTAIVNAVDCELGHAVSNGLESPRQVGNFVEISYGGENEWDFPLAADYYEARTQIIYLQDEIGDARAINGLALFVNTEPQGALTNFTIRMKHTDRSEYDAEGWESSKWTTVYQNVETISGTGWVSFAFERAFHYDGVSNVFVDISFNNDDYAAAGYVRTFMAERVRSMYGSSDGNDGDPLAWSGDTTSPGVFEGVPVIRFTFGVASSARYFRVVRVSRSHPRDTDGDGIDDVYELERSFLNPVVKDGTQDHDYDGVSNFIEYRYKTDPDDFLDVPDLSNTSDSDGDGYNDVYEVIHSSNPSNSASVPDATIRVDGSAATGGDGSAARPYNTIAAALEAASAYDIIEVADGTYTGAGNTNLDFKGKTLLLKSANGPACCIIDGGSSGRGFAFENFETAMAVVSGMTIQNGYHPLDGGGILCSNSDPTFRNCIIRNNATDGCGGGVYAGNGNPRFYNCVVAANSAAEEGGGIYAGGADIRLQNCTITGNRAGPSTGGGIYGFGSFPTVTNCILWNNSPDQIAEGDPTVSYSIVQGGWAGDGNLDTDPLLTAEGRLRAGSPCIDAGSRSNAPVADLDGEARWDDPAHANAASIVDIGADEFVDTDGDAMADAWEWRYFHGLGRNGSADADAEGGPDGLTELEEYEAGTDPEKADTDADGLLDGPEVKTHGTSPMNPDTDGDAMSDAWEVRYGLDALDAGNMMTDRDRDRYGNLYECVHGSIPTSAASVPAPTLYVDPSAPGGDGSAANPFNTIQSALNAAGKYDVVALAEGIYTGDDNRGLDYLGKPLMLVNTGDISGCVIDCEYAGRGFHFHTGEDARSVLSGVTIRRGYDASLGGGLVVDRASPTLSDCVIEDCAAEVGGAGLYCHQADPHLLNCTIKANLAGAAGGGVLSESSSPLLRNCIIARNESYGSGAGFFNHLSSPTLHSCTVADNHATGTYGGGGFYNDSGAGPVLHNCIVWENSPNQVAPATGTVTFTSIAGGWTGPGNIGDNPLLTGSFHLKAASPCIDAGSSTNALAKDIDGQARWDDPDHANIVSIVDLGAREFTDSDADDIDDGWERRYFSSLARNGTADNDSEGGPDGLTDSEEYAVGSNPQKADTDGDGLTDGEEVKTYGTSPVKADTDRDGLSDYAEVHTYHTSPRNPDHDGDGLRDGEEVHMYGSDPDDTDSDDDTMPDGWEVKHGLNPTNPADAAGDADDDWLSNADEHDLGTDPNDFDTDDDLLPDGVEADVPGWDPLTPDDPQGDLDGDGLSNLDEIIYNCRPDRVDTDGDGVDDKTEVDQGSDPNDASEGGVAPPPEDIVEVRLTVGDHSGSESERYCLIVGRIRHQATQFGVVQTRTYKFRRGHAYAVTIHHTGSALEDPDYDYHADIEEVGTNTGVVVIDEQGILGYHDESRFFFAAGKEATLVLYKVQADLDVNADGDIVDNVDGVAKYMPGFEDTFAEAIQWDANGRYTTPQTMNLVAEWEPADYPLNQVTFEITRTTAVTGFCMNSQQHPGGDDDFSFSAGAGNDKGPKNATINQAVATVPFYCKDFGGYCEIELTCARGTQTVYQTQLEIPKDDNNNEIADAWFYDLWNGTGANYDGETNANVNSTGDGLTRYEEYRGFLRKNQYERMSAASKELFIFRDNESYGVGAGPPTLAEIEFITADEMNGAAFDTSPGTRDPSKTPRIVNFNFKPGAHRVNQHGLWVSVRTSGNPGSRGNWGRCWDAMGGTAMAIGPPKSAGRVDIYQENLEDACGPVNGTEFNWDASAMLPELLDDTISHEIAHGLSVIHPTNLPALFVTNYATNFLGNWRGSYLMGRRAEGGPVECYMRYNFSDCYAAISGDNNKNGTPLEAGESHDRDWSPTVPDATTYSTQKLAEVVIDDADEP